MFIGKTALVTGSTSGIRAARRAGALRQRRHGKLECEGCGWTGRSMDAQLACAGFEAHHLAPLSEKGESQTKLKDVVLLCATCHRITHRWIALTGEWLTRSGIAQIVSTAGEAS